MIFEKKAIMRSVKRGKQCLASYPIKQLKCLIPMPVQGLEFKLYVGRSILVRVRACKRKTRYFLPGANLFGEQLVPTRWYKRLQGGDLGEGCDRSVYIFRVFRVYIHRRPTPLASSPARGCRRPQCSHLERAMSILWISSEPGAVA